MSVKAEWPERDEGLRFLNADPESKALWVQINTMSWQGRSVDDLVQALKEEETKGKRDVSRAVLRAMKEGGILTHLKDERKQETGQRDWTEWVKQNLDDPGIMSGRTERLYRAFYDKYKGKQFHELPSTLVPFLNGEEDCTLSTKVVYIREWTQANTWDKNEREAMENPPKYRKRIEALEMKARQNHANYQKKSKQDLAEVIKKVEGGDNWTRDKVFKFLSEEGVLAHKDMENPYQFFESSDLLTKLNKALTAKEERERPKEETPPPSPPATASPTISATPTATASPTATATSRPDHPQKKTAFLLNGSSITSAQTEDILGLYRVWMGDKDWSSLSDDDLCESLDQLWHHYCAYLELIRAGVIDGDAECNLAEVRDEDKEVYARLLRAVSEPTTATSETQDFKDDQDAIKSYRRFVEYADRKGWPTKAVPVKAARKLIDKPIDIIRFKGDKSILFLAELPDDAQIVTEDMPDLRPHQTEE